MKQRSAFIIIVIALVVIGVVVYGSIRMGTGQAPQTPSPVPEAQPAEGAAPKLPEAPKTDVAPTTAAPKLPDAPTTDAPKAAAPKTDTPKVDAEEAFLKKVSDVRSTVPPTKGVGSLPPVGADSSLVPVILLEPADVLDMGIVTLDKPILGEIKIHNKGKVDLVISRVASSCGCTKVKLRDDKKTIPPGDYAVIDVDVDPKKITGFESRKTVTVFSNDRKNNRVKIDVLSRVDPEFMIEPNPLDFGQVKKGNLVEAQILFRQLKEEPIEVLHVTPDSRGARMQASFVKKPEQEWLAPGRAEYLITIRLPEDVAPGPYTGTLMIQTTCKRLRTYRFPVKATVTSFYTVGPAKQLMIRTPPEGKTLPPSTTKIESSQPFEIQDLQCSTPDVLVSTRPGEAPNAIILEATMNPEAKPGRRRYETITFTIKSGDETLKHTIPVLVYPMTPNTRGKKAPPPAVTKPQSNAGPTR